MMLLFVTVKIDGDTVADTVASDCNAADTVRVRVPVGAVGTMMAKMNFVASVVAS